MSWIKLYRHIKRNTKIEIISSCETYRRLAKELPEAHDTVLEIGCSTGLATKELSKSAKKVFALDTSPTLILKCREDYAHLGNVSFIFADARDIEQVKNIITKPDIIFIDIGGDGAINRVCSILRLYLLNYTPRLLILRNFELAIMHELVTYVEVPKEEKRVKHQLYETSDQQFQHLIDLSHSDLLSDRLFAAKKLLSINEPFAKSRLQEMHLDPHPKVRKMSQMISIASP